MMGLQRLRALGKPLANITPRRSAGHSAGPGAYRFGIKPGTSSNEGWEGMVHFFYGATAFVLIVGLANKPSVDMRQWAKEEALARNRLRAKGEEVEWGTFYNKDGMGGFSFVQSDVGTPPSAE